MGVGWDGGLLGLSLHLRGESVGDRAAWQLSEEGRAFSTLSSAAWGAANVAAGADPAAAATAVANTTAFYAPDPRRHVLSRRGVDSEPSAWRYSDQSDVTEGGIPMANLVVHFEIHASEPQRLIDFYGELLGWPFSQFGDARTGRSTQARGRSATSPARPGTASTAA